MKSRRKSSPVVVVGSIALDSVKTAFGEVENALGGSATYFTAAARNFCPVQVVGVIGSDFPEEHLKFLKSSGTDIQGVSKVSGETFRWKGSYEDPNQATTHETRLNVFADFNPELPALYRQSRYVFLANIHPSLQERVLSQIQKASLIACDTMNHWIRSHREEIFKIYPKVDVVFLNDGEAKLLSGEDNLVKSAKTIHSFGPCWVIIKKGEHGVLAYDGKDFIALPSYPVEKVVDPTGAGDSFAGAFMGYIARSGKSTRSTVVRALAHGAVVASFTIQDFSVKGLAKATPAMIEKRYREFLRMFCIEKKK